VQEVHLIFRLGYCRVAQSTGLVEGIPNLLSELNGAGYLTQRTSTDTLGLCRGLWKRGGANCFRQSAGRAKNRFRAPAWAAGGGGSPVASPNSGIRNSRISLSAGRRACSASC
jgi:hypothetical protein